MINTVSQAFKAKLANGEIPKIRMQFVPASGDAFWLSDGDFWADGTSFTEATSANGEFSIGAAIIGAFNFTLNNFDGNLTDEVFRGALVIPLLYFEIDGENEYLAKGVYYIATHRTAGNLIRCTAYDGMKLLDEHRTDFTYPITVQNLITTVCTANSITLATPTIPNGSYTIPTAPENQLTDRQMLSYACQITGNFAKMDENGQMVVGWYDTASPVVIDHTFEGKDLWTNSITITGVKGVVNDSSGETVVERTATYGTTDCMVVIRDNPYMTPTNLQAVVNMVGQRICGITFRPGSLPILSNPCIQAGDVLIVTDNITGNSYHLLATEITYTKQIIETVICNFNADEEADIRPTIESITNTTIGQAKQQAIQAASAASAAIASASQAAIAAQTADAKAEAATRSATAASTAAQTAQDSATAAASAASVADQKATDAQNSADEANESARSANVSANSALVQLSVVEDVAGTLNWISQHGSYIATTDTEVAPNKVYFEFISGKYIPIAIPDQTANPSERGWYELDVTDSQSEYIMSHLAVTQEGLWVLPSGAFVGHYLVDSSGNRIIDSSGNYIVDYSLDPNGGDGYKILLSNTGMTVYNSTGTSVAEYSTTMRIGVSTLRNILVNSNSVDVKNGNLVLASFFGDEIAFYDGEGNGDAHKTASFGKDGAVIGAVGGNSVEIDYRSLKLFDKEGNEFFRVMDFRDENGCVSETFEGTGTTNTYKLALGVDSASSVKSVTVDGIETTSYTVTPSTATVQLADGYIPASGAEIVITYEPTYTPLKTKTLIFGPNTNNNIGAYGSVAMGSDAKATANNAFAVQSGTAEGPYAFASGDSVAHGPYSRAGGYECVASRGSSVAEGSHCEANGNYSAAFGRYCVAGYESQFVVGRRNDAGDSLFEDAIFVVGIGAKDPAETLRNGFIVDSGGDLYMALTELSTPGKSTKDGDLYDMITALGWESEVLA
jgi:hypothetical protein